MNHLSQHVLNITDTGFEIFKKLCFELKDELKM